MNRIYGLAYLIFALVCTCISLIFIIPIYIIHYTLYKILPKVPIIRFFNDDMIDGCGEQMWMCKYTIGIALYMIITNRRDDI